jgi:hypothetical protein
MAKANVLLALASELPNYPDDIYLRVYLADTLMTGEDTKKKALVVKAGERDQFYIPLDTLEKGRDLDSLVDKMSQFAKRGAASKEAEKRAEQGFAHFLEGYTQHEMFLWRENFRVMVSAVSQNSDTIWGFILKNAYRPAYLRRQKVDVIVANPPWLSLRDIKDRAYKLKIKELTFRYKLLGKNTLDEMCMATPAKSIHANRYVDGFFCSRRARISQAEWDNGICDAKVGHTPRETASSIPENRLHSDS